MSMQEIRNAALIEIFRSSLEIAKPHLESAKGKSLYDSESLYETAKYCFKAFQDAADALEKGQLPVIEGSNPHVLGAGERSALANAVGSVDRFLVNPSAEKITPHSIEVLKALKPIAEAIHKNGFSLSA